MWLRLSLRARIRRLRNLPLLFADAFRQNIVGRAGRFGRSQLMFQAKLPPIPRAIHPDPQFSLSKRCVPTAKSSKTNRWARMLDPLRQNNKRTPFVSLQDRMPPRVHACKNSADCSLRRSFCRHIAPKIHRASAIGYGYEKHHHYFNHVPNGQTAELLDAKLHADSAYSDKIAGLNHRSAGRR